MRHDGRKGLIALSACKRAGRFQVDGGTWNDLITKGGAGVRLKGCQKPQAGPGAVPRGWLRGRDDYFARQKGEKQNEVAGRNFGSKFSEERKRGR